MWRSCFFSVLGLSILSPLAVAQNSGPGPASGIGSQQYDVLVVGFPETQRGTFTFAEGFDGTSGGNSGDGTSDGGSTGGAVTGANPSTAPTTGTGSTSTSGDVNPSTTTTSGAARTGTATRGTSFYQSSGLSSRLNRSSGSYGFGTVATVDNSTNGTSTNTSASGSVNAGFNTRIFSTGEFTANLETQSQTGTWYAVDLGRFALFFATATDTTGNISLTGFATPEAITGRITIMSNTNSGSGNAMQAMVNAGWFVGTAADTDDTGTDTTGSGISDDQTSNPGATAN